MQDTQSDPDNSRRLGVDEQYIKFRPSPNFKNMKKFLKSKIDHSESASQSPPNGSSEQTTPNTASESPPRTNPPMEKQSPVKPVVHPPLPLEPPPPDSPPIMPVPIKNEIIDTDYQDQENGQESPNLSTVETEDVSLRLSLDRNNAEPDSTSAERPKVTVCRDFIRGTCSRAPCRYAHQRDLSQLVGIYTFCRNYQNTICTYPQCKYVHATVFEEQEFYRTGTLPPHALNHSKKPFYMLPPPPPPPPEEAPPEVQQPSPRQTNSKLLISCVPVSKLESKPAENDFRNMLQAITSPLKRAWIDPFCTSPRDLDHKELYTKKCKHCDNTDIRLQYNKEKWENMENNTKELQLKTQLLSKKTQALFTVLFTVIKQEAATAAGMNKLSAKLSLCGEKEREVLHQILDSNRIQFSNMIFSSLYTIENSNTSLVRVIKSLMEKALSDGTGPYLALLTSSTHLFLVSANDNRSLTLDLHTALHADLRLSSAESDLNDTVKCKNMIALNFKMRHSVLKKE